MNEKRITVLSIDVQEDCRVRIRAPRVLTSREWDLVAKAVEVQREAAFTSSREVLIRHITSDAIKALDKLPGEDARAVVREVADELGITVDPPPQPHELPRVLS
jgi:hypothetical protein